MIESETANSSSQITSKALVAIMRENVAKSNTLVTACKKGLIVEKAREPVKAIDG